MADSKLTAAVLSTVALGFAGCSDATAERHHASNTPDTIVSSTSSPTPPSSASSAPTQRPRSSRSGHRAHALTVRYPNPEPGNPAARAEYAFGKSDCSYSRYNMHWPLDKAIKEVTREAKTALVVIAQTGCYAAYTP